VNRIYAPWRHAYVTKSGPQEPKKELKNNCIFCDKFAAQDDEKHYLLKRFKHTAVMMNLYPYNGGHIMVLPYEHKGSLDQLSREVRSELMEVVTLAATVVKQVTKCEGMNIGLNLGPAGGGGIQEHLHMHVLPRWRGDSNFLVTLTDTSLICTDFNDVYRDLKQAFDQLPDEAVPFLK